MRKLLLIILLLVFVQGVRAQELKATEFKALVNIKVASLTNEPASNELIIFSVDGEKEEYSVSTGDSGTAQILLPKGKTYNVKYKDLIEKIKHSKFEVPGGLGKYSFDILIKFDPSDIVEVKGLLFTEEGTINEISAMELDLMNEVLVLNPKMEVVVAVHSDNSEDEEMSLKKTQEQAELIKDYFVENGISQDRIKAIGFGMSEPIAPNVLPEGRERNNRIEIRVTKKYL